MDVIETLVDIASEAVEQDMLLKPTSGSDGIWRFDRILAGVFGTRDKEFWLACADLAYKKNIGAPFGKWTGYSVTASYASCRAAYATPGFAEARSKYMT